MNFIFIQQVLTARQTARAQTEDGSGQTQL